MDDQAAAAGGVAEASSDAFGEPISDDPFAPVSASVVSIQEATTTTTTTSATTSASPPIPPVIDDMTATTPTTLVTPNSTVSF